MRDMRILPANDPEVPRVEASGYVLVGESWGARLRLSDPPDLSAIVPAVTRAEASGIAIRELAEEYAEAVYQLELANHADYPVTPATTQPFPEREVIRQFWTSGKRVFGAIDGDFLVAVTVGQTENGVGDNDFASVLKEYRGRGVGAAVAAASIIALARDGIRVFTAGGAAANAASLGLAASMGFVVEEQWRSYERI